MGDSRCGKILIFSSAEHFSWGDFKQIVYHSRGDQLLSNSTMNVVATGNKVFCHFTACQQTIGLSKWLDR